MNAYTIDAIDVLIGRTLTNTTEYNSYIFEYMNRSIERQIGLRAEERQGNHVLFKSNTTHRKRVPVLCMSVGNWN